MSRFTDRHAVVTGGTSGIGLATARRIADEGGRVLVTGQDPDRLAAADAHDGITAIADDNADDNASSLRDAVERHLAGRVDVLFLNAGLGAFAPLGATTSEEFDRQFDINVRGPFLQLRHSRTPSPTTPPCCSTRRSSTTSACRTPLSTRRARARSDQA